MTSVRGVVRALVAGALCLGASGCRFDGVQSVELPGGVGTGEDAQVITVELPDVGTLTPNSQVRVGDVAVGTVTDLRAVDWHAEATLSLEPDVRVPANAVATVGINSLLGSSYVELASPAGQEPQGTLEAGARIPLSRGGAYPSTEKVLSSASLVLNGGGLQQLATITAELNKAVGGNNLAVRDLLPRLDSFVAGLDAQRGDIVQAIRDLDRLSDRFAKRRGTVTKALDKLGPALQVLSKERPDLTRALKALNRLGDVATPLARAARRDLVANLRDLVPALEALSDAGDPLVSALGFAVTFPFAPETVTNACSSDYCNLFLTLDLRTEALLNGLLDPNGAPAYPGLPGVPDLSEIPLLGDLLDGVGPLAGELLGQGEGAGGESTLDDLLTGGLGQLDRESANPGGAP